MRRAIRGLGVGLAVAMAHATGAAGAQPAGANYDEAKVPAYTLPDPLRSADGAPVRDAGDWTGRRRTEVLRLFEAHVYGRSPAAPAAANDSHLQLFVQPSPDRGEG